MVPGAPVATSGILFAVPAFREWLRLSVRTTYHSPIPLSICGAPCRPALCPSRPPTFPPSDSPALRLSRPPTLPPSDSPALRLLRPPTFPLGSLSAAPAPAFCPHSICEASRRPALRPSRPPTFPLGSLSAASAPALCPHSICEASRRSALCSFRPPPVPSSVSFALRSFFCLARLFLFLTPSSIWMGISGEDFPRGQLFCIFPSAGFQHTLIYLIYIRSECRFRTPPGTVLFCRSDAAASLPVCLSACLLVRRTFHLNFFRLLHLSSYLPPDLFAPCRILRPSFFAGCSASAPIFHGSSCPPARIFSACHILHRSSRPTFCTLPHPSSALFRRSPLPNSGFSPLAPFPNSIFSPPAAPFFPPFLRKFAAPFGKVKALLRASPPELRIGPTPTSALPRLLLRPQSSRHRFYGQNASCRFTMRSKLRQKNIQKNL